MPRSHPIDRRWLEEGLTAEKRLRRQQGKATSKPRISGATKKVEEPFTPHPYQNHVCLEPMNATALYTPEKCEVWTSTQNGEAAYAADHRGIGSVCRQMRSASA